MKFIFITMLIIGCCLIAFELRPDLFPVTGQVSNPYSEPSLKECLTVPQMCLDRATQFSEAGNHKEAVRITENMCNAGSAPGCKMLGFYLVDDKQLDRAYGLQYDYCINKKDATACELAGLILVMMDKESEAQYFFKKACREYGKPKSCQKVGLLVENTHQPQTPTAATKMSFEQWIQRFHESVGAVDQFMSHIGQNGASNESLLVFGRACQHDFQQLQKIAASNEVEIQRYYQEAKVKYGEAINIYIDVCSTIQSAVTEPAVSAARIAKLATQATVRIHAAKEAHQKARSTASVQD